MYTYRTMCPSCWIPMVFENEEWDSEEAPWIATANGKCDGCGGEYTAMVCCVGDRVVSEQIRDLCGKDEPLKNHPPLRVRQFDRDSLPPHDENSHRGLVIEDIERISREIEEWESSGGKKYLRLSYIDSISSGRNMSLADLAAEVDEMNRQDREAALAAGPPKWEIPEDATEVWSMEHKDCGGTLKVLSVNPSGHDWGQAECDKCGLRIEVHWQMWSGEVGKKPGIFSTYLYDEEQRVESWKKFVAGETNMYVGDGKEGKEVLEAANAAMGL